MFLDIPYWFEPVLAVFSVVPYFYLTVYLPFVADNKS